MGTGEAEKACWACNILCETPTRAHVIAASHGGSNDPENFFLLCDHCHDEQPDGASREQQERWLFDAPSFWEWSGRVGDEIFGRVKAAARRRGLTDDDVSRRLATLSFEQLGDLISTGYRSAGGIANGRANCATHLTEAFLEWAAPPAKEPA